MIIAIILAVTLPVLINAYTWSFSSTPAQCTNLSLSISGTDGKPPYRVLIIPFGPTPLPNFIEARKIVDQPFQNSSTSLSFQLAYPTNSQFVAVVSDATGFGTGGTSVAATVQSSSDSSCYDATTSVSPAFIFSIYPTNQIVQCTSTRIWWDDTNNTVDGTPTFLGVIPGGQSFTVPTGPITNVSEQGTGFSWTPSVRGGTTLLLVGGDSRGAGNAGSTINTVGLGTTVVNSCLNDTSPSSTPGNPAGGSYPTSTTSSTSSSSSHSTNTGAIAGGTVGGVAFLILAALAALFCLRRKSVHKSQKERPVDILQDDEGDEHDGGRETGRLPQYYQPEPFLVPDPTITSAAGSVHETEDDALMGITGNRPISGTTTSRSGTPDLISAVGSSNGATRKGGLRVMRPVNIIQHDDAGPSEPAKDEEGEPDTIELPPAYTNLKTSTT
jgi:hypothetical protein